MDTRGQERGGGGSGAGHRPSGARSIARAIGALGGNAAPATSTGAGRIGEVGAACRPLECRSQSQAADIVRSPLDVLIEQHEPSTDAAQQQASPSPQQPDAQEIHTRFAVPGRTSSSARRWTTSDLTT